MAKEKRNDKAFEITPLKAAVITVICLLINITGSLLAKHYSMPFWGDGIGTVLSGIVLGPASGIVVGASTNLILGITDNTLTIYGITGMFVGFTAGIAARKGIFSDLLATIMYGISLAVFAAVVSALINILVWNGSLGNIWGDAVITYFDKAGLNHIISCFLAHFYLEFVDKIGTVCLAFFLLKLQSAVGKRKANRRAGQLMSLLLLLLTAAPFLLAPVSARADSIYDSHTDKTYNETNGLLPGHATSVATTRDGILWVGTYAGLYSYDGVSFDQVESSEISNVNCLFTDSEGRLWVGTNDSGLSIILNDELANTINRDDGLVSDSVRSVVQAADGTYYVGTSGSMQIIKLSDGISVVSTIQRIQFCTSSAAVPTGEVIAVGNDGQLYVLKGSSVTYSSDRAYFTAVMAEKSGRILAGSNDGRVYEYTLLGSRLVLHHIYDTKSGSVINSFTTYTDGSILALCDNGMYRFESGSGKIGTGEFRFSLQRAVRDYQGNLWIASSRQGLLEISPSAYTDLFSYYEVKKNIVNAVFLDDETIYTGCDNGIIIYDRSGGTRIDNALTQKLSGIRVRDIASDASGNIYAASYGRGLVEQMRDGKIVSYQKENGPGDRVRTVIRLSDGSMASSGDNGISFIKNGKITDYISLSRLGNTSVLSLSETSDGKILAGTDGDGYFIIADGNIVSHFSKENGLSSDVILKTVPVSDSEWFLVTSNSISLYKDGSHHTLDSFPYRNNYDLLIDDDGNAYVTGSAGIFITTVDDLLKNDGKDAVLSSTTEGLPYPLVVNSRNQIKDGIMYLSGEEGVIRVDLEKQLQTSVSFRIRFKSVSAGGSTYIPDEDDLTILPGDDGVVITPQIISFVSMNPFVEWKLDGYESSWHRVSMKELEDITLKNLPAGDYKLRLALLSHEGRIISENSLQFTVRKALYETVYFKIYLLVTSAAFLGFITWFFTRVALKKRAEKAEAQLRITRVQVEMGNESVKALAKALFSKDRRTGEHSHQVAEYAATLGKACGFSQAEIDNLRRAALLHDIGKVAIPDAILNKPARLTDEEYEIMKTHTTAGADILKGFTMVEHVSDGARFHHERYDGKGYPKKLSGEDIPLYGRIIAVADAFDAMTANRVYREALDMDIVINELKKGRGTQFDPYLDDLFLQMIADGTIDPKKTIEKYHNKDLTDDLGW